MMWWPRRRRPNRLQRLLAAAALQDAMERAQAAAQPVWAYTKSGRVAHLLGPDGHALCPLLRSAPASAWVKFGSDEEREAALPPCHACEREAAAGEAAS